MADLPNIFDNDATTQRLISSSFNTQVFTNTPTDSSFSLGAGDTDDYFRLQLSSSSNVRIVLNSAQGNADLALLDGTGDPLNPLARSQNTGILSDAILSNTLTAGTYYIRVSAASGVTTDYSLSVDTIPLSKSDILWRNYAGGQNIVWLMDRTTIVGGAESPIVADPSWILKTTGDMDGDGNTDYIWRNTANGATVVWYMSGYSTIKGGGNLPSLSNDWDLVGTADVNKDGKTDLFWRNVSTGENVIWYMDNLTIIDGKVLPTVDSAGWTLLTLADVNNDGSADLIWRSKADGQNLLWLLDGPTTVSAVYPFVPLLSGAWTIVGGGDFTGDGKTDLMGRKSSTGENVIFEMDGINVVNGYFLPPVGEPWRTIGPVRSVPVVDLAGNTMPTAFNIGTLNGSGAYRDNIGTVADTNDYYKFTLSVGSTFNLSLSGLGASDSLQLLQDLDNSGTINSGNEILPVTITTLGNGDKQITQDLNAGTYFIRVFSTVNQAKPYTLNVNAVPANQIDLQIVSYSLTTTGGGTVPNPLTLIDINTNPSGSSPQVRINYNVRNTSVTASASFRISFYLSRDSIITTSDYRFGNTQSDQLQTSDLDAVITGLAPGASNSGTRTVTLPVANDGFWGSDQTYYIGMIIDAYNQVVETSESNNTSSLGVGIRGTLFPDVVGNGLNAQSSATPGQTISVSGSIRNLGNAPTGPTGSTFTVFFFLSSNEIIGDADDTPITPPGGPLTVDRLPAFSSNNPSQSTFNFNTTLVLPNATGANSWANWRGNGVYYIGMWLNLRGEINESVGGQQNNLNYGISFNPDQYLDFDFITITGL